jgi:thiosulfate sulfurtransferase
MFVFERNNNRKPTFSPVFNAIKTFLRDAANIPAGKKTDNPFLYQVMAPVSQGKLGANRTAE